MSGFYCWMVFYEYDHKDNDRNKALTSVATVNRAHTPTPFLTYRIYIASWRT